MLEMNEFNFIYEFTTKKKPFKRPSLKAQSHLYVFFPITAMRFYNAAKRCRCCRGGLLFPNVHAAFDVFGTEISARKFHRIRAQSILMNENLLGGEKGYEFCLYR